MSLLETLLQDFASLLLTLLPQQVLPHREQVQGLGFSFFSLLHSFKLMQRG